jgi:hypothetical protein
MQNDPPPDEQTHAASKRATDARKLAESLEQRAEDMHRAAAAAQASVAQFAEMVREHEPDIASKIGLDPERYRRLAAGERARADRAQQRREEDIRHDIAEAAETAGPKSPDSPDSPDSPENKTTENPETTEGAAD